MTQAKRIVEKCGGAPRVAEIAGVDVSRVYRWCTPKEKGGTGGLIPSGHHAAILSGAKARGIDLHWEDFAPGAST